MAALANEVPELLIHQLFWERSGSQPVGLNFPLPTKDSPRKHSRNLPREVDPFGIRSCAETTRFATLVPLTASIDLGGCERENTVCVPPPYRYCGSLERYHAATSSA